MLDNLIHGYFILDHPERLDYDYEHIYALVAYRAAKASGKITLGRRTARPRPGRRLARERRPDLPDQVFASRSPGKKALAGPSRRLPRRPSVQARARTKDKDKNKKDTLARSVPRKRKNDEEDRRRRPCFPTSNNRR